ncbi:hypothetical protein G647_02555 [Cladophialophora carrionii CBS 160.54]|uniref:Uncharacterized protein n=1 Tax=Cladophialophora carrionii CBS 160.54 TaxID=1279043 RepID=V9DGG6_9EURO|nr:uncharacterized protein G647_02555 [Cladophialophora carrionii CBS 160.54]ETI25781.1 hypothetical protein G647_02555 [Cladophialophora carrionii CBS 160.54]
MVKNGPREPRIYVRKRIVLTMPIPQVKNDMSKVQLLCLAHVYIEQPDLHAFDKLAKDCGSAEEKRDGKHTTYFRG